MSRHRSQTTFLQLVLIAEVGVIVIFMSFNRQQPARQWSWGGGPDFDPAGDTVVEM